MANFTSQSESTKTLAKGLSKNCRIFITQVAFATFLFFFWFSAVTKKTYF